MKEIVANLVLALGIILGAGVLGDYYVKAKSVKTPTVKSTGIASKEFMSDTIKWKLSLEFLAPVDNKNAGYASVQGQVDKLIAHLTKEGIERKDITINPPTSYAEYGRNGEVIGYRVSQTLLVISKNMQKIEDMALKPASLDTLGLNFGMTNLEYFYSGIDELKKELLSLASANAKERASEITKGNSYQVGDLIDARAGVFQITEPYSTDVAYYGVYDTQSPKKEIRVTVSAEFELVK